MRRSFRAPVTQVCLALLLAALLAAVPVTAQSGSGAQTGQGDAAARLHDLFDREWEVRLKESPLFATSVGRHEYDDRLPSVTEEDLARSVEEARGFLAELATIDRSALGVQDRVSYDIFRTQLEDGIADFEFGAWQIPINADSGFHIGFARLPQEVPLFTVDDYENYIARLDAFPTYVGQQIANMRKGLERGMTLPKVTLKGYEKSISGHVVGRASDSVFWAPFESFPTGVPATEHARLRAEGERAIMEGVVPGYQAFLEFMTGEYIPGARETLGASELPDGERYYDYLVHQFTTLDVTAKEVHEIGLAEVARIEKEMLQVLDEIGFEGSLQELIEELRTDPRFYPKTGEELLKDAAWIAKSMDGKLPKLFKTLPRLPYGVEPVPDEIAPKYTAGRYVGAPKGSTKAGTYWVNTYDLPSRPLYALEALTLHEAVPGHHLQIALSEELEDLPPFRRFSYISAFGEGWGLYSEHLGLEVGFYTDPYSNFGRLTYEMWRACRLVVDTGIHAFGWTREQAIDYLASHTALSLHEVTTETDRYISWPGQALAYKMGELEITRLRKKAEAALGERFDVREFHDAVLLQGSIPLPVLADRIDAYIAANAPPPPIDPDQPSTLLPNGKLPMARVLTGGQPNAEQLAAIADLGYRTVVNLRTPEEPSPFANERSAVQALGMRYVAIPVAGAAGLTGANVDALSRLLGDDSAYPVVIHCASGNRVGALIALDAAKEGGKAAQEALELGLAAGLTRLEPAVREKLGLPAPD